MKIDYFHGVSGVRGFGVSVGLRPTCASRGVGL